LREPLNRSEPRSRVGRPNQGFGMPVAAWLRGPPRDWAEDLVDGGRVRAGGGLDPEPVRRKWKERVSGRTSWDYDLWCVLMFQAWLAANQGAPEGRSGTASLPRLVRHSAVAS